MSQFLMESMILTLIALILAIVAVDLVLPGFSNFISRDLSISGEGGVPIVIILIFIGLVVGFLSGLYPAFYLSKFQPIPFRLAVVQIDYEFFENLGIKMLAGRNFSRESLMDDSAAYFLMKKWLSNFAYHIAMAWYIFILAVFVSLGIALLTVGFQAVRIASRNPEDSIKYE